MQALRTVRPSGDASVEAVRVSCPKLPARPRKLIKKVTDFGLIYYDKGKKVFRVPLIAELKRAELLEGEETPEKERKLMRNAQLQVADQARLLLSSRIGMHQESVCVVVATGDVVRWSIISRTVTQELDDINFNDPNYYPPKEYFKRGAWSVPKKWEDSDGRGFIPTINKILSEARGPA
ncbi:hypothetical protein CPC08DRAFT_704338 [Agrocybe pediades]|nr:hypothetical protein CPC08DRAFT_704338 [Agrocybe pediades]